MEIFSSNNVERSCQVSQVSFLRCFEILSYKLNLTIFYKICYHEYKISIKTSLKNNFETRMIEDSFSVNLGASTLVFHSKRLKKFHNYA